MTAILLIDDIPILGIGLRAVLEAEPDLTIVVEMGSIDAAMARRINGSADVAIVCVHAPAPHFFDDLRALAAGGAVPVLVLTPDGDLDAAVRAFAAGASGYLPCEAGAQLVIAGVRAIVSGGAIVPLQVAEKGAARLGLPDETSGGWPAELTGREREVLALLAGGRSNPEIARSLHLAVPTVKRHVAHVMEKLGAHSRVKAVLIADRAGLGRRADVAIGRPRLSRRIDARPAVAAASSHG